MIDLYNKNINSNMSLHHLGDVPQVIIFLCTYNGADFLGEQLDSLMAQTYQNWVVIASDDGSTDQTLDILKKYQSKWPLGKLSIRSGPHKGFCQNFLSLACDPEVKADYYAFCDQDDVWLPEKLSVAINIFDAKRIESPYLYCGRTVFVDELGNEIGRSPRFIESKTFKNALVQCVAGGNTMIFNVAAKLLLEKAGLVPVPSHDWWLYQLITGSGGAIYFDQTPRVMYRQHSHSLVGENASLFAKFDRFKRVLNGQFRLMISANMNAIAANTHLLTAENIEIFNLFKKLRSGNIRDRFRLINECGIYRQSKRHTVSLIFAALLKKI